MLDRPISQKSLLLFVLHNLMNGHSLLCSFTVNHCPTQTGLVSKPWLAPLVVLLLGKFWKIRSMFPTATLYKRRLTLLWPCRPFAKKSQLQGNLTTGKKSRYYAECGKHLLNIHTEALWVAGSVICVKQTWTRLWYCVFAGIKGFFLPIFSFPSI